MAGRFQLSSLAQVKNDSPATYQAVRDLRDAVSRISDQGNFDPTGARAATPASLSSISVVASGGFHDVKLTDNAPGYPGVNHFAYYSQTPDFNNEHQIDLGASLNHKVYLGAGSYYWRANHSYQGSDPSEHVYHGGQTPQPVGSGVHEGPPMQAGSGQNGYGITPYRNSPTPPVRK